MESARWNTHNEIRTLGIRTKLWNPHHGTRMVESARWNPDNGVRTMDPLESLMESARWKQDEIRKMESAQ